MSANKRLARRPRARRHELPCKDKARFASKDQAVVALHKITSHGDRREKMPCRVYFCDPDDVFEDERDADGVEGRANGCGGWHLTSQER